MNKTQIYLGHGFISGIVALLSARLGILFWVLLVFLAAMMIDFASGMMASKKESIEDPGNREKGWSSKKGLLGIFKKLGYILVVTVAILVDYLIFKISAQIGITMPAQTLFGLLITVWFILNELLSIIENAGRMGVEGIPSFLTDAIAVLKNGVEKKGKGEK